MTAAQPVCSNTQRMCSAPSIPPETITGTGSSSTSSRGEVVVRHALVAHRGAARVERDAGDARLVDQPARQLEALHPARLDRRAQLDGHGQAGALARGARDRDRECPGP